jgi:RNA polymerase sigma-70 factor (ECF subfamily)
MNVNAERVEAESDQAIVAAVLAGERDAYALLIGRYQRRVFQALRGMTGSSYDAEELTQETFYRAYFALASYNPDYRFSTWIFQIAYNLCRTAAKKRQREVGLEDQLGESEDEPTPEAGRWLASDAESPGAMAEASELEQRVWRAVAALPPEYRDVVIMRHVNELTYEEICELTGLPMGTVKSRLARARRRLAKSLEAVNS